MFAEARKHVLSDRDRARKALAEEIRRSDEADLEQELDELARQETEREAREAAERDRLERVALASGELREARKRQAALAADFDAALAAAEAAFVELEALSQEVTGLERIAGEGAGARVSVRAHARSTAIVAALWSAAPSLCRRLRLQRVPSGPHNVRALTTVYNKEQ